MKINKKQFKKWIKALRSGKYKKTTGTLEDEYGFCCLGVACKVLNKSNILYDGFIEGTLPFDQPNSPKWLKKINDNFQNITSLNRDLHQSIYNLTDLNDTEEMSFDEIADVLEAVYIHKVLE